MTKYAALWVTVAIMLGAFSAFQGWVSYNESACRERAAKLDKRHVPYPIETSWMPRRGCSWRFVSEFESMDTLDSPNEPKKLR